MPVEDPVVLAAQRGDLRSFEVLVRRHSPQLYRVARRTGLSEHLAEDALQIVWLAVWRALPEFQGRSQLSTWLHTLTGRTAYRLLGRHRDDPVDPTDAELGARLAPTPSAEQQVQRSASDSAVRDAVALLPPDLRQPLVLHHFEGLSYPEIADRLRLPVATVRGRIYRGRRQLAKTLQDWR